MSLLEGFSSRIKKSANGDEYYSDERVVRLIVPYLLKTRYRKILCPFDKPKSAFMRVLSEYGFSCYGSHIELGKDFFTYTVDELNNLGVDCIVSNPPFSKRNAVFEHLYKLKKPFAMVMNFNGLFDAAKRIEIFKNNDFELLIPKGRMRFRFKGTEEYNHPTFQSIYVCSNILDRQIVFDDSIKF